MPGRHAARIAYRVSPAASANRFGCARDSRKRLRRRGRKRSRLGAEMVPKWHGNISCEVAGYVKYIVFEQGCWLAALYAEPLRTGLRRHNDCVELTVTLTAAELDSLRSAELKWGISTPLCNPALLSIIRTRSAYRVLGVVCDATAAVSPLFPCLTWDVPLSIALTYRAPLSKLARSARSPSSSRAAAPPTPNT